MIPVSANLQSAFEADVQHVEPRLKAWLADLRYLDNARTYSSSESLDKLVKDRDPICYLKLDSLRSTVDELPAINRHFYDYSGNGINLYPATSSTYPDVLTTTPTNWLFYKSTSAYERYVPKRVITTFSIASVANAGYFDNSGSVADRDYDLKYWTWSTNDTVWSSDGTSANYLNPAVASTAPLMAFIYVNSGGLHGIVDWKGLGSNNTTGGLMRYVDDNNFVMAYWDTTAGGTFKIVKRVGGVDTTVASAVGAVSSTKYYRLESIGNTFNYYDMGTSEPTDASVGTLLVSGYIGDDVFQTSSAYNVGYGAFSLSGATYDVKCDYFAFSTSTYKHKFVKLDGTQFLRTRYNGGLDATSDIEKTTFTGDFSIIGTFQVDTATTTGTIIYKSVDFSPKISQWRVATEGDKLVFRILNGSTNSYITLTSVNTITIQTPYTFAVTCVGNKMRLYLNDNLETVYTLPTMTGDVLYPSEVLYPNGNLYPNGEYSFQCGEGVYGDTYAAIMVGADAAGTTFGEADNPHYLIGRVGDIAILNTGLSSYEVAAINKSVNSAGVVPFITTDDYFSSSQIIDGFKEQTFSWAVTNLPDKYGNSITANGESYAVGDTINASPNYGWMSRVKSDGSGNIANESVGVKFDSRIVNKIRVTTGYTLGGIRDFSYSIIDSDDLVSSGTASFASGESVCEIDLVSDKYLKEILITPTKLWNANDYAHVYSIDPIYEVDLSDYVISFNVENIKENLDATLPIGSTGANSLSLELDNTDLVFNPDNEDSVWAEYIRPDSELFLSLAWDIGDGTYEEIVMADSMFVDTWGVDEGRLTVQPSARDYSKFFQEGTVNGFMLQNVSAAKAVAALAMKAGLPARKIDYYKSHTDTIRSLRPYVWFKFADTPDQYSQSGLLVEQSGIYVGDPTADISLGNSSLIPSNSLILSSDTDRGSFASSIAFEPSVDIGSAYVGNSSYITVRRADFAPISQIEPGQDYTAALSFREVDVFYANIDNTILRYNNNCTSLVMKYDVTQPSKKRYLQLGIRTTIGGTLLTARSTSYYDFGEILHVVMVKSGANYKVWVNDVLEIDNTFTDEGKVTTGTSGAFDFGANTGSDGQYSDFTLYSRAFTQAEVDEYYMSVYSATIPLFRYFYSTDESYWDAMLSFATADVGMFYFDRYGNLRYDFRNVLHDEAINLDFDPVYELSDETNIIDGKQTVEVQVNKVNVNINGLSSLNTEYSQIWAAETGESLAVTTITSSIDPNASSIPLANVDNPLWLTAGLVKIDDEIISYNGISGKTLLNASRGMYGTSPTYHNSGAKAREARYYEVTYSDAPAVAVRYPFITAEWLYDLVDVDFYYVTPYKTKMLVSANKNASSNKLVILEGKDAVTELEYNFRISGIPIKENSGKSGENIEVVSEDFLANQRRWRLKEMTIDNKFITNKTYANSIASFVLTYYSDPVPLLDMSIHGVPHIELNDIIEISKYDRLSIANTKYWILENKISYDGGIKQDLKLHKFVETKDIAIPAIGTPKSATSFSKTTTDGGIYYLFGGSA